MTDLVQSRIAPSVRQLYPLPPIMLDGATLVVARLPEPLCSALPPGTEKAPGGSIVVFGRHDDSALGSYREVLFLTPARTRGQAGWFCPLSYVTTDVALAAGREIWGFPHRLADIDLQVEGSVVHAELHRAQTRVVLEGQLDPQTDDLADPGAPTVVLNEKVVPGVIGFGYAVHTITAVETEIHRQQIRAGRAHLRVHGKPGDDVDSVLRQTSWPSIPLTWALINGRIPDGRTLEDLSAR